jgi:hypothetical protein
MEVSMCNSLEVRQPATENPGGSISCQPLDSPASRAGFFSIFRTEFRRALAAVRRYEQLKYGRARHENLAPSDVARKVFDEIYAAETDAAHTPMEASADRPRFHVDEWGPANRTASRGMPRRRRRKAAAGR